MKFFIVILILFFTKIRGSESEIIWEQSILLQNSLSYSKMFMHFVNFYLKSHNFTNEIVLQCYNDIEYAFKAAFIEHQSWALTMFDSYGKPETGIFDGNIRWEGNEKECAEVNGKYCWLEFPLSKNYETSKLHKKPSIEMAICAPKSCSSQDLLSIVDYMKNKLQHFVTFELTIRVRCLDEVQKNINADPLAQMALYTIFVVIIFMICGTYADYVSSKTNLLVMNCEDEEQIQMKNKKPVSVCVQFLLCFSVISNGKKIFQLDDSSNGLTIFHGFRVLAMWGVVMGHTFTHLIPRSDNPVEMLFSITYPEVQFIVNLYYVVDIFFVISGFLTVYIIMRDVISRGTKCNFKFIFVFIAHRYWRLVSTMLLILFIFRVGLLPHLTWGPLWENPSPQCRQHWWRHILFINNYFPHETGCDPVTWFLASSMQLHIFSILLILPLFKPNGRFISFCLGGLSLVISCFYVGYLAYHYNIPPIYNTMTRENAVNFSRGLLNYKYLIYVQSHYHMGPYLIGMITGWFVYEKAQDFKISKVKLRLGWFLSIVTLIGVFNGKLLVSSRMSSAIYVALSGVLCSLAYAWIIVVSFCGKAGFVKSILSWKYFHPLSKINYTLYLIHGTVIVFMYGSETSAIHFSNKNCLAFFFRHLLCSIVVAFPLSLAFESPMLALEKMLIQILNKNRNAAGSTTSLKKKKLKNCLKY